MTIIRYFLSIISVFVALSSVSFAASSEQKGEIVVQSLQSSGGIIGCGAYKKNTPPVLIITILINGSGTLSVLDTDFKVSVNNKIATAIFFIGNISYTKIDGFADGNLVTFMLTKQQLLAASNDEMAINGISMQRSTVNDLIMAAKRCLNQS